MLLFKKKDLLVVISKSGETVQFTKPLKAILKYQHRYNYKFKMYENGAVTVADDYVINGETLTVLFGSATVSYTSEGATYTEGSGGSGGASTYWVTFTTDENGDFISDHTMGEIVEAFKSGKMVYGTHTELAETKIFSLDYINELTSTYNIYFSCDEAVFRYIMDSADFDGIYKQIVHSVEAGNADTLFKHERIRIQTGNTPT